jgi:hypothetical protein
MAGAGCFLAALYVDDADRRFASVGQIAASTRHSCERSRPQKVERVSEACAASSS